MKLYDVQPMTPTGTPPDQWAEVLRAVHGDHTYCLPADRISWLKRLAEDEVWGEVTVVTTREQFAFWRLCSDKVVVEDEAGKHLGKPQRTSSVEEWAAGLVLGDIKKAGVTRLLKAVGTSKIDSDEQVKLLDLLNAYNSGESNGLDLYIVDGDYQIVSRETLDSVYADCLERALAGSWWCWDSETDDAGEEDSAAPNPWTAQLVWVSIGFGNKHSYNFPIGMKDEEGNLRPENISVTDVMQLLSDLYTQSNTAWVKSKGTLPRRRVILHNCKYDYSVLANPIQQGNINEIYFSWLPQTHDTMLMAALANEPSAALKKLAVKKLGLEVIDFKKLTRGKPFSSVPLEHATTYAGQDADWPMRLYPMLLAQLEALAPPDAGPCPIHPDSEYKQGSLHIYYEHELPVIEYFMRMERRGFKVDAEKLTALGYQADTDAARAFEWMKLIAQSEGVHLRPDFNPGSSQQRAIVFFSPKPNGFGMPVIERTKTGAPSTGKKALNQLKAQGYVHRFPIAYTMYVKATKLRSAFVDPWLRMIQTDGRIHATWMQIGAATGRTSAHDPNPQQASKPVRECIIADIRYDENGMLIHHGELGSRDYSQVELRVLAAVFFEPKMLETFNLPRKILVENKWVENEEADIHARTQKEVGLESRTKAKNYNFGVAFEAGANTLSVTSGTPVAIVRQFLAKFYAAYPDYTRNKRVRQDADLAAGVTFNWAGRGRLLPPAINSGQVAQNERYIANTPVQGGALEIIKCAMRDMLPLLRHVEQFDIHPWNMVHDELDWERGLDCSEPQWQSFLRETEEIMERVNPFIAIVPTPTDLEVGTDWAHVREPDWNLEVTADDIDEVEAVPVE